MFRRIEKIFQQNLAKYALGPIVVLLLFLSTGHDFFHSHDADFDLHEDCPVYHFLIMLSSLGVLVAFVFEIFIERVISKFVFNNPLKYNCDEKNDAIRGPPDSSFIV